MGMVGKVVVNCKLIFDYFGHVFAFWFDCQALVNGRGELEIFFVFSKIS